MPVAELAPPELRPITVVGMGKMGVPIAGNLAEAGHPVFGWDESQAAREAAAEAGIHIPDSLEAAIALQQPREDDPRIVWHMVPEKFTEDALRNTVPHLGEGDIPIDGGNSFHRETTRRERELGERGLRFLGVGVSGGLIAARLGYPQMVGGNRSAYDDTQRIFDSLAAPHGGHKYFGHGGAGHYVKMWHNAGEYALMEALAETMAALGTSEEYDLDMGDVTDVLRNGSLLAGYMLDRVGELIEATGGDLSEYRGAIGSASGETVWAIQEGRERGLEIGGIEHAAEVRKRSGSAEPGDALLEVAAYVAGMRAVFGGHSQRQDYVRN